MHCALVNKPRSAMIPSAHSSPDSMFRSHVDAGPKTRQVSLTMSLLFCRIVHDWAKMAEYAAVLHGWHMGSRVVRRAFHPIMEPGCSLSARTRLSQKLV